MTKKEQARDKRIWNRMGRELAALHDLIVKIQCDREYQSVMDRKTWDKLRKLTWYLDQVRSSAEDRMSRYVPDWSTQTFYPSDRGELHAANNEFRRKMEG